MGIALKVAKINRKGGLTRRHMLHDTCRMQTFVFASKFYSSDLTCCIQKRCVIIRFWFLYGDIYCMAHVSCNVGRRMGLS